MAQAIWVVGEFRGRRRAWPGSVPDRRLGKCAERPVENVVFDYEPPAGWATETEVTVKGS